MSAEMTTVYEVGSGLYVNLTNRCSCSCVFCLRQNADGLGSASSLWLDHEPSFEEVASQLEAYDVPSYSELVFCGYGEPTQAFEMLKEVAAFAKERWAIPIRINTNGHGNLINGRDIVPELAGIVDALSISLNAPNAQRYQELSCSQYGEAGFDAMLDFAQRAVQIVSQVTMSTVGTMLSQTEEEQCQEICMGLGARYRIRAYEG